MRSLLEQLEAELTSYAHLNREGPAVRLLKTGQGQGYITARLTDVGKDFIEIRGFSDEVPPVKVSRAQIAEISILPKPKGN